MNLLLLLPSEVGIDGTATLAAAHASHLRNVLHVRVGDEVRVGIIDGPIGVGTVTSVADDRVALRCVFDDAIPNPPGVDVLLALPRPKVMRRLWAQLAAMGVGQVILTNAEKVERDYFDSHVLQEEGYRPLLLEGLQQARDTRVPVVSVHKRFKVLIENDLDTLFPVGRRVVADPSATASVAAALTGVAPQERVLVAIGPEGGWNDFELRLLDAHGFQRVGMGPRTLATTTACIALLTLVHAAIGRE